MFFSLLLAQILFNSFLITPDMDEALRYKALSSYFYPSFDSYAIIDKDSLYNRGEKDPFKMLGFIKVMPPKGSCFVITRNSDVPDDIVCKPTKLSFRFNDIDKGGKINWIIKTSKQDPGYTYSWKTPHRIAFVIPLGEKLEKPVPIDRCVAHVTQNERKIILKLMNGKSWIIYFPQKDVLTDQPPPWPNLYMQKGGKVGVSKDGKTQIQGLEQLQAKGNPSDPVTKYWAIPKRGSYEMSASNFVSDLSPSGIKGKCLYQFSNAPDDPDSGWIECHETSEYEVVFAHLECARYLKPQHHQY